MSCEIAGIKVKNGVIIDGFYNDLSAEFEVGSNYFCGSGEEAGTLTTTPSNLFIGKAVDRHRIKLDIRKFDNIFYTQISNTYYNASLDEVTNNWILTAPSTRVDDLLNLEKGDLINFLAPTDSAENQNIILKVKGFDCPFLLTKHEGSSLETKPITKGDLTQGTWVTAFYNPDETIGEAEGAFRVDLAAKGEFLKLTGGIITGETQFPSICYESNDNNEENDKIIINKTSDDINAIEVRTRSSDKGFVFDFTDKENPTIYSNNSDKININNRKISGVKYPEESTDAATVKYVQDVLSITSTVGRLESFLININNPSADDIESSGYCFLDGRELELKNYLFLLADIDKVPYKTISEYYQQKLNNLRGTIGYFGVDLDNLKIKVPYLAPGDAILSSNYQGGSAYEPGYYQRDQMLDLSGSSFGGGQSGGNSGIFKNERAYGVRVRRHYSSGNGFSDYIKKIDMSSMRVGDRVFTSGICAVYKIYVGIKCNNTEILPEYIPYSLQKMQDSYTVKFRSDSRLVSNNISSATETILLINNIKQTKLGNLNINILNDTLSHFPLLGILSTTAIITNFVIKPQIVNILSNTYLDVELQNNKWYLYPSYVKNKIIKNISAAEPNNDLIYNKNRITLNATENQSVSPNGNENENLITIPKDSVLDTPNSGMIWSTDWVNIKSDQLKTTERIKLDNQYLIRYDPDEYTHKNYKYRIYNNDERYSQTIIVNDVPTYVTPKEYIEFNQTQIKLQHFLIDTLDKDFDFEIAYTKINYDNIPYTLLTTDVYLIDTSNLPEDQELKTYRIQNNSFETISYSYTGDEGNTINILPGEESDPITTDVKWVLNTRDDPEFMGKIILIAG